MFCENPKVSKSRKGKFYVNKCGKCRACRLAKANNKMIVSVFAAAEYQKKGQFLTLTYDDEHLPHGLQIEHFQSFMKKLRELDGTPDVKMFYAGEYGSKTHREHWHVLFYNHRYDIEDVKKAWSEPRKRGRKKAGEVDPYIPLGFVYDGTLTPKSMKYVSGYIDKKGYEPDSGKRPPFGRSSVNLPDGLTAQEKVRMCETGKIQYNGRTFSVPPIWRRRYRRLWNHYRFKDKRLSLQPKVEHLFRFKSGQDLPEYIGDSDGTTPQHIIAQMDEKERKYNERKASHEKKRLQRLLNRRIM